MTIDNYVTKTPSNIRKGLGYKDRPPHEKSEECKRFECELDAELDEIDDSREKLEDDIQSDLAALSEYGKLMLDWYVVMDWLDRQAAITEREVEHDLMLAGRMAVEVERKRIAELTAERDELQRELDIANAKLIGKPECEICDRATLLVEIEKLRDERDGWKAKAKSILNAESYKFASEPDAESYIDCGKVENDSREKLEEAAWEYDASYAEPYDHGAIAEAIIELLDRQAAITEREFWECYANGNQWEARQYEARCMELTAERDALARDLAECDENRIEFRDQRDHAEEMLAQMERERDYWKLHPERWADKCKEAESERDAYHERVCELEIELAQANGNLKNTTHNHAAAKAKYERAQADAARAREKQLEAERRYAELLEKPPEGAWAERIAVLEAGNEELRERLSEALGHAHEIGKLGDLEAIWES